MEVLLIDCPNTPGQLTRVADAIAAKNINISSGAGAASGSQGTIALLTADESGARAALDEAGIGYRATPCVTVTLPDQPGTLAELSRRLAEADINIECLVPVSFGEQTSLAIGVDDTARAERALGR